MVGYPGVAVGNEIIILWNLISDSINIIRTTGLFSCFKV